MIDSIDICIPSLQPLSDNIISNIQSVVPAHHILSSQTLGRGLARQELIQKVDTEWMLFLDTDVRLKPDYWRNVIKYIDHDVGAIQARFNTTSSAYELAVSRDREILGRSLYSLLGKHSRSSGQQVKTDNLKRAFTGATLIKTSVLKGISIPNLRVYEDEFIRQYVLRKGFSWIRTKEVLADHLSSTTIRESDYDYETAKMAVSFGHVNLLQEVEDTFVKMPLEVLLLLGERSDESLAKIRLKQQLSMFKGVIHGYCQKRKTR